MVFEGDVKSHLTHNDAEEDYIFDATIIQKDNNIYWIKEEYRQGDNLENYIFFAGKRLRWKIKINQENN